MKILHLSDLHFGTEIKSTVEALQKCIQTIDFDILVITGDFTQRARTNQFLQAKKFLESLNPKQAIYVPGNHDIPLYNFFERFCFPLRKYRKYIDNNLLPSFYNNDVAMLGINSTTPFKAMSGVIGDSQLKTICEFFDKQPIDRRRIVIMHHNLIRPELHTIIENSEEVIQTFAKCKVNLILSGHLHDACVEVLKRPAFNHPMYVVTAGTSFSYRLRSQPNSFNLIKIDKISFKLMTYQIEAGEFSLVSENDFSF